MHAYCSAMQAKEDQRRRGGLAQLGPGGGDACDGDGRGCHHIVHKVEAEMTMGTAHEERSTTEMGIL